MKKRLTHIRNATDKSTHPPFTLALSPGRSESEKQLGAETNWKAPTIGRGWRATISILIALHLLAVIGEPLRFFSQSPVKFASEEARLLRIATRPYSDLMYLSHGYSFFAPNPGPSHLLECELIPNPGSANASGAVGSRLPVANVEDRSRSEASNWRVFPDRKSDWPRLLYHRYFMLSEFYHSHFAPITLAEQDKLDPGTLEQWKQDLNRYQLLQASIQKNLTQIYPDHAITLRRIEHILPSEYQILVDRWKLTDPRLYAELPEGDLPVTATESLPKP